MMNLTVEQVKNLINKYPYLKPVNAWTREPSDDYDYSYVEGSHLSGWSRLFLLMCKNIAPHVEKIIDKFYFTDVKEKYGRMRVYTSCTTSRISHICNMYEQFSFHVCMNCGSESRYEVNEYLPMCENCTNMIKHKNVRKIYRASSVTFNEYTSAGVTRNSYSFRPIRSEYNKVKNMTDQEFVDYLLA